MSAPDKAKLSRRILLFGSLAWSAALFLPPLLSVLDYSPEHCYGAFATICHQYDSRSLHIFGHKLAVCARCSAIYWGFTAGVVTSLFFRVTQSPRARFILVLAVLPMVLDVLLNAAGIHASSLVTRLLTGGIFGYAAAYILVPLFEEGCSELLTRHFHNRDTSYVPKTR